MDTKEFWEGEGGDEYTKRNRVDWRARIPFWKMILDKTGARSVFEFGCNAGWNLSAIKRVYPDVQCVGYEINDGAIEQANYAGHLTTKLHYHAGPRELSFTAGALIHIPPSDLSETMQLIIDKSCDYVLAIEYYAYGETEIEYRGEKGLLWKRPYGMLYQNMGLKLIETGKAEGFDDCEWSLLRK